MDRGGKTCESHQARPFRSVRPNSSTEPKINGDVSGLVAEDVGDLFWRKALSKGEGPGSGVATPQGTGQPRAEAKVEVPLKSSHAPQAAPGMDEGRQSS